jgi:hypothetical protein
VRGTGRFGPAKAGPVEDWNAHERCSFRDKNQGGGETSRYHFQVNVSTYVNTKIRIGGLDRPEQGSAREILTID